MFPFISYVFERITKKRYRKIGSKFIISLNVQRLMSSMAIHSTVDGFFQQAFKSQYYGALNSKWFLFIENGFPTLHLLTHINTYDGSLFRCELNLILAIQWQISFLFLSSIQPCFNFKIKNNNKSMVDWKRFTI